jgi:GT2 family glycosyltransferase
LGTALYRREVFGEVGGFDTAMSRASDFDWFVRADRAGVHFIRHPVVTYLYRHHPGGLTGDMAATRSGHISAVRKALHRKRAAAADAGRP